MRTHHFASVITLRDLETTSFRFTLRVSGDPVSGFRGHAGVEIVVNMLSARALFDWFLVYSDLCAVRLYDSVPVSNSRLTCICFFVVVVRTSTNCSSAEAKTSSVTPFNKSC